MRDLRVLPLLLLPLLFTAPLATAQEESRTVTAEGVAVVQGGARDIARDAAVQDAQHRAVEQAIGTLIDSQTQVENFQVISDNILSQTKGYIKRYNIMGERMEDNLLRVTISAEVALGKLSDDLSAIGILLGQMHKPRTMVLIAEQNIGQEWIAWWMTGVHGQQTDMGMTENTLMDVFSTKGFEMIDHEAASRQIKVTAAYNVQNLSDAQARTLGSQADAEVVIVGKTVSRLQGNVGALKSASANLVLKAIRTDTGQVIASVSHNAPAVHINEITAGNEAIKKATQTAAEQLATKILAQYSKEVGGTRSVNLTVYGLTKTQFVKFKDVLRNQVRGIKNLNERSFANGVAKLSVDMKGSAQVLSDELSLKNFGDFSVEVTASTANTLELKVVPPGGSTVPMPAPQPLTAPAPAMPASVPAPAAAPAAAPGYLDGGEYLVFDSDGDKSGQVGKMLTPATPTHPEAEFLMFGSSSKRWSKHFRTIRQASPAELQVGARVVFFEGHMRENVYALPTDKSEARMRGWWRDLVTDNSLASSRGIITVGGYKVSTDNVFIELK